MIAEYRVHGEDTFIDRQDHAENQIQEQEQKEKQKEGWIDEGKIDSVEQVYTTFPLWISSQFSATPCCIQEFIRPVPPRDREFLYLPMHALTGKVDILAYT